MSPKIWTVESRSRWRQGMYVCSMAKKCCTNEAETVNRKKRCNGTENDRQIAEVNERQGYGNQDDDGVLNEAQFRSEGCA
jgi:hypothetical protein